MCELCGDDRCKGGGDDEEMSPFERLIRSMAAAVEAQAAQAAALEAMGRIIVKLHRDGEVDTEWLSWSGWSMGLRTTPLSGKIAGTVGLTLPVLLKELGIIEVAELREEDGYARFVVGEGWAFKLSEVPLVQGAPQEVLDTLDSPGYLRWKEGGKSFRECGPEEALKAALGEPEQPTLHSLDSLLREFGGGEVADA